MRQAHPTPAADRVEFIVRFGWPEFKCKTIQGPAGSDVASVTRSAKLLPFKEGRADTCRWVPFSWEQRRFLAPDEQAPLQFVVGPYEALLRDAQPPEPVPPEVAASDRERYERRWEDGLRNIVTILHGSAYSFEIGAIVEEVRALAAASPAKPQPGSTAEERVEFARRTGCWDGVTDRDYRTWLASLQQTIVPPDAGRLLTDREISDRLTPGYQKALLLVRGGHPTAFEVAAALGGDSADGPEGNVWALFDMRLQAFLKGRFEVLNAGPVTMEPCRVAELSPGAKAAEVPGVVLRDNGILAVFYDDGHIAFGGDAADMVAFRDMAATVVGAPKAAA